MIAFSYWRGKDFGLLEYLSARSSVENTTAPSICIFYDSNDPPMGEHWAALDRFPRLVKRSADTLLSQYTRTYLSRPIPKGCAAATVSDFFRYAYLYENGGLWFDLDAIQIRDVYSLYKSNSFLVGREDEARVSTGILGITPRHRALERTLAAVPQAIDQCLEDYLAIGPPLFTESVRRLKLDRYVLPSTAFYPIHYSQGAAVVFSEWPLSDATWSVHIWGSINRPLFRNKRLADFCSFDSTFFNFVRRWG